MMMQILLLLRIFLLSLLKKFFSLYDSFGSRVSVANLLQGNVAVMIAILPTVPEGSTAADETVPAETYFRHSRRDRERDSSFMKL